MPKPKLNLLEREFTPSADGKEYSHLVKHVTNNKTLSGLCRKINERARTLGIKIVANYDTAKSTIVLSSEDYAKWEHAKSMINKSRIPLKERVFDYDEEKMIYFHKPEYGTSISDLATNFNTMARQIDSAKITFSYDIELAIITLSPEEYTLWYSFTTEAKNNNEATKNDKPKTSKKRKANAAPLVKSSERQFFPTKDGTLYEHQPAAHENSSKIVSTLNRRVKALNLDKKIVKFHSHCGKVIISATGYNLWRTATSQQNSSNRNQNTSVYKNTRLYERVFLISSDGTSYVHIPEEGTSVDRLLCSFNLKAKGLRLDTTIVKFNLNPDKHICISPEGYNLWTDSFPRQNCHYISTKDRLFFPSEDQTYYEHFPNTDLYVVARDLNNVARKLNLSKALYFRPNLDNGSVVISAECFKEWTMAMRTYTQYKSSLKKTRTAVTNTQTNISDTNNSLEILEEAPEYNIYDSIFALSENEDEEYDLQNIVNASNEINAFPFETPALSITPWSQNYCGPSGLFQHVQRLQPQINNLVDFDEVEIQPSTNNQISKL